MSGPGKHLWIKERVDRLFASLGLRLTHRQWLPKGTDRKLYVPTGSAELAPEPSVILEVGANVGQLTRLFSQSFPKAAIHAFEPAPHAFAQLVRNTKRLGRVTCHDFGFGAEAGKTRVLPGEDTRGDRTDRDPGLSRSGSIEVVLQTLDAFVEREGIPHIDILRCDTEGHELEVLEGARMALSGGTVRAVLIESTLDDASATHVPFEKVETVLRGHGFELFGLYDFGFSQTGRLEFFSALFKLRQPS